MFANEIDNMALIMPSQDKHAAVAAPVEGKSDGKPTKGRKRSPKKMEMNASLNVACLKRLLPIGLNMFGGREQELIQQSKQMLIDVSLRPIDADACQMKYLHFARLFCFTTWLRCALCCDI